MANSQDSGEDYLIRIIRELGQYEDEILSHRDLIDTALKEQLDEHPTISDSETLIRGLSLLLEPQLDQEVAYEVGSNLYSFLVLTSGIGREEFDRTDVSREFFKFLQELRVKHQLGAQKIHFTARQGENYWSNMETDFVFRQPDDEIGMNHTLGVGHEKKFELTTNLNSNLQIAAYFLEQQERAQELFSLVAANQIDKDTLDQLVEMVEELQRKVEKAEEEMNE